MSPANKLISLVQTITITRQWGTRGPSNKSTANDYLIEAAAIR